MRIAIAMTCVAVGLSTVIGVLSMWYTPLIWGCITFGIIALTFGVRFVYLKVKAENEPYHTEYSGVIVRVDPRNSYREEPQYFL